MIDWADFSKPKDNPSSSNESSSGHSSGSQSPESLAFNFSKFTFNHPRRGSYSYQPNQQDTTGDKEREVPLSMKFMHKPSRSRELLEKASDPTKINSLLNSQIGNEGDLPVDREQRHLSAESPHEYRLVRKKSGELLKPSLKDSSCESYFDKKRSKSLPTTPTFKQVHFGGDNDVRYFKKKDKPTAISASNSPTLRDSDFSLKHNSLDSDIETAAGDDYDNDSDDDVQFDNEYTDFELDAVGSTKYPNPRHEKLIDWKLQLLNFPTLSYDKKIKEEGSQIFLERIFLSSDKKYLLGHIAVKNLAFEKHISVRYTLDNWLTIVEIPAEYVSDIPSILKDNNYDRFIFKVPLDNLFNSFRMNSSFENLIDNPNRSQEKTYHICIKYNSINKEFWDNNSCKNYKIKLIKTIRGSSNSKIQTHDSKPKYSSSYLKRRGSDSQLEIQKSKANNQNNENENSSSADYNDFIKNNYYLSSPLLSSYNNSENNNEILNTHSTDTFSNHSPSKNFSNYKIKFMNSIAPSSLSKGKMDNESQVKEFNKNFFDTKSYKELIENYCFFSTSSTNEDSDNLLSPNIDSTGSSTSSSSSTHFNESSKNKGNSASPSVTTDTDKDSTLTISSILGV